MRQPYLKNTIKFDRRNFPNTEYVHFYGYYIGNYPSMSIKKIRELIRILNSFY